MARMRPMGKRRMRAIIRAACDAAEVELCGPRPAWYPVPSLWGIGYGFQTGSAGARRVEAVVLALTSVKRDRLRPQTGTVTTTEPPVDDATFGHMDGLCAALRAALGVPVRWNYDNGLRHRSCYHGEF